MIIEQQVRRRVFLNGDHLLFPVARYYDKRRRSDGKARPHIAKIFGHTVPFIRWIPVLVETGAAAVGQEKSR